jgi:hypothetical protein
MSKISTQAEYKSASEIYGIHLGATKGVLNNAVKRQMAMDAQPSLVTTSNAGIPFFLANYFDPDLIEVLVTPNKAAVILGEAKKGDWTTRTAIFPIVERTGEVSSYGDYSNNGVAGFNANFPERQNYLYQVITQWGELELEMTALARIDTAAQKNIASAIVMSKFENQAYFYGIAGLQNYGLLNDPSLSAPIAPGYKTFNTGNGPWITNGQVTAQPQEVYADIQALFLQLVLQSGGLVDMETSMVLAMSPASSVALTATNVTFATNVIDLVKKNFPNIRVETAIQYSATAGNSVQLIAENVEGQDSGYCAFSEKMRAHPIIRDLSSFKQKKTGGVWGSVIRIPFAFASMLGV